MAMSRSFMGKQVARPGKVQKVMHEFKTGTLKSSSGQKVTKKAQAIASAMSEANRANRPRRPKRKLK